MHLWTCPPFETELKVDTRTVVRSREGHSVRRWPVSRSAAVWQITGPLRQELALSIDPGLTLDLKPEGTSDHLLLVARDPADELARRLADALTIPLKTLQVACQSETAPPIPLKLADPPAMAWPAPPTPERKTLELCWQEVQVEVSSLREVIWTHPSQRWKEELRLGANSHWTLTLLTVGQVTEVCAPAQQPIPRNVMRSQGYSFGDQVVLFRGHASECSQQAHHLAQLLQVQVVSESVRRRDPSAIACPRCDDPDCPRGSLCPRWSN